MRPKDTGARTRAEIRVVVVEAEMTKDECSQAEEKSRGIQGMSSESKSMAKQQ